MKGFQREWERHICERISAESTQRCVHYGGAQARLCSFIFQRAFCNRRHLRLGDGEAGEAATQTNLYLGEQQDAGIVQMLGSKMNHHLNRQFSLFG